MDFLPIKPTALGASFLVTGVYHYTEALYTEVGRQALEHTVQAEPLFATPAPDSTSKVVLSTSV